MDPARGCLNLAGRVFFYMTESAYVQEDATLTDTPYDPPTFSDEKGHRIVLSRFLTVRDHNKVSQ